MIEEATSDMRLTGLLDHRHQAMSLSAYLIRRGRTVSRTEYHCPHAD